MEKRIIIHIGAGKTGTSAIQSGLARYHKELKEKSILYPMTHDAKSAASGKVTSGNCNELLKYLSPKFRNSEFNEEAFLRAFIKKISDIEETTIIFSNEQLEIGDADKWETIRDLIHKLGDKVEIVYTVRSIVEHAYSVYSQMIKRSGFSKDFEEYSSLYRVKYQHSLNTMISIFGRENVTVINYDKSSRDLLNLFLKKCSCDILPLPKIEVVNRSLNYNEICILRQVNMSEKTGKLSKVISDHLIYNVESDKSRPIISQASYDNLYKNNSEALEWINKEFFYNGEHVEFTTGKVTVGDETAMMDSQKIITLSSQLLANLIKVS